MVIKLAFVHHPHAARWPRPLKSIVLKLLNPVGDTTFHGAAEFGQKWQIVARSCHAIPLVHSTTELLNVLNVLGWLVDLEPVQATLLERVCSGPMITVEELRASGAFEESAEIKRRTRKLAQPDLYD